jgi:hypothetical protein
MSSPFGMPPGVSAAMPAQSHNPMPQNPTTQMEDRLTVGPCIISYPALFVPKEKMGDPSQKQYSAEFIVLMETPEQHAQAQQIYQRMMTVANTVSQHKFQRNADTFRNKCLRPLSERKGFESRPGFFFSAKSIADPNKPQNKPDVLIGNPPVHATDPDQVYAGALVYCTVKAYAYDNGGNQGVGWFLNSVLKVGDGPRLAGDRDAASDYADILASMPVSQPAPVYAPPGYAAPPAYPPQAYGQPAAPAMPYGVPPVQQQYAAPPAFQSPPMPGYPGFPQ